MALNPWSGPAHPAKPPPPTPAIISLGKATAGHPRPSAASYYP